MVVKVVVVVKAVELAVLVAFLLDVEDVGVVVIMNIASEGYAYYILYTRVRVP